MRRILDRLYLASGVLSGLFLMAIAVTIIAQVIGRLFHVTVDSTETAGFCLAASTFLGLAYTFKTGGHIRVNLLLRVLPSRIRRIVEIGCVAVGTLAVGYTTYWAFDLVYFSFVYNEISPGLLAIPFWIPRSGMALGLFVLFIAFADELVSLLCGGEPSYENEAEVDLDALAAETAGREGVPAAAKGTAASDLRWSQG
ncbi:TRAP transporter small permease [Marinivivus vitaminiproducens]|uniref:TRAP transporter small permease n=1 Tax=Marinivivus vitaminiproducens TaxID=3035935 RepID=UPI0027A7B27F|nr:TRAP transporter small permease [Geminicoccaceae bacterium SCSIO 64248]